MVMVQRIVSPDVLSRSVLFVVELVDPVSLTLVSRGIGVQAQGLSSKPTINLSGRFVWLREAEHWPTEITIDPQTLPFAAQTVAAPARPADLNAVPAAQRLLRVVLRPTPAYPFESGVTALRGQLRESDAANAAPLVGARVQLAVHDEHSGRWLPAPPVAGPASASSPEEQETDASGSFAAFVRLPLAAPAQADVADGMLKARLQLTRVSPRFETRATSETFSFVPGAANGRLPEGALLGRDLSLAWSSLIPV